jgi:hypothetical protein
VIPAIEVSAAEGHLIGYGILKDIPSNLPVAETAELIYQEGGIVVVPHLYRIGTGIGDKHLADFKFDGIEIVNNRCFITDNKKAAKVAKNLNTAVTGGSDAHQISRIGSCITRINTSITSYDEMLELIRKKQTMAYGIGRNPAEFFIQKFYTIYKWAKRGFKRA